MSTSSIFTAVSAAVSQLAVGTSQLAISISRFTQYTRCLVWLTGFIISAPLQAAAQTNQTNVATTTQTNTATATVTLNWQGIAQADGYQLEEKAPGATHFTAVNIGAQTSVTLSGRAYGEYRYRVIGCLAIPPSTSLTCSEQIARYSDELVTQLNAPQLERRVIFLHTDALGSPAAQTDIDGDVLN